MPPVDLGQVASLNTMLHRTSSAALRGAGGQERLASPRGLRGTPQACSANGQGPGVSVVPKSQWLTTGEATDSLGISRPTLVKLLEGGEIPFEQPSRHRRVLMSDEVAFNQWRRYARRALAEMTRSAAEQPAPNKC
jgi:excisionase family DNA binding protein